MLIPIQATRNSEKKRDEQSGARFLMIPFAVLTALSLCSCKSRQAARVDPFLNDTRVSHSENPLSDSAKIGEPLSSSEAIRNLAEKSARAGRTQISDISQASSGPTILPALSPRDLDDNSWSGASAGTAEISSEVNTVAFQPAEKSFAETQKQSNKSGVSFSPAEPRVPLWGVDQQEPDFSAEEQTEEYLFDGGDRDDPVHYDGQNRLGLDTEDTVAEYFDDTGRQHTKASNRVAIYSPRFGSVRSFSEPTIGVSVDKLASAVESRRTSALENQIGSVNHIQRDAPDGLRVRSRVSGVETESKQAGVEQRTSAAESIKLNNVYENLRFLRSGQFVETERARISYGMDAAEIWSKKLSPVISGSTSSGQEVHAISQQQELVGVEERTGRKGQLRIVKLADKKLAHPGDIITFTIRYDNIGQRELHGIQIVDNLSPRLQYVEDSATSDKEGRLVVEDNQEGSLVLKFEVAEPLPGASGGIVTFQARVR